MSLARKLLPPALAVLLMLATATATSCTAPKDAEAAEESTEKSATDEAAKDAAEEAVPVTLATARRGRIEALLRATANLEAERQVQVYSGHGHRHPARGGGRRPCAPG